MHAFRMVNISLVVALAFALTGCGSGTVGQVEGIITLDGQPVPNARVSFTPQVGKSSMCENTDAEGHYVLYFGTGQTDPGATVGSNTVTIKTLRRRFNENREREDVPAIVPDTYNVQPVRIEDCTSGSQTINFELTTN